MNGQASTINIYNNSVFRLPSKYSCCILWGLSYTCTRLATRFIAFCSPTNRKSSSQSVGFCRIQRQENEAEVLFILCDDDNYDDAEFAADVSRRCVVSCCAADDAKGKR
jgi:hypothetical protein